MVKLHWLTTPSMGAKCALGSN